LKLLAKFNLLLLVAFGIGLAIISMSARSFLLKGAREQVLQQAALVAASASATRDYTAEEVSPTLEKTPEHAAIFLPQTIPFFAATATFEKVRKSFPDYTYKEAALNPTNPRDRANDWESDLITSFRNTPGKGEVVGERSTPAGQVLYIAHPIAVATGCLQCHSQPSAAPRNMLKHYGSHNGFGWQPSEIVGAQIISVPMSVPIALAEKGFRELLINLGLTFLAIIVLVDIGLYYIVVRPLKTISTSADRISTGELDLPQLPVKGKDELAEVTSSFNRMHTSLKKAFDLLNE
jgi:HAMP domain-containing protein